QGRDKGVCATLRQSCLKRISIESQNGQKPLCARRACRFSGVGQASLRGPRSPEGASISLRSVRGYGAEAHPRGGRTSLPAIAAAVAMSWLGSVIGSEHFWPAQTNATVSLSDNERVRPECAGGKSSGLAARTTSRSR